MIMDRILFLINEKNMNANRLAKEIGLSNGVISVWKKGIQRPSIDVLVKIADYFDVSIDYLTCRTNNPKMNRAAECFIGCDYSYSEADIVLLSAGFDGTTSYRSGTRFGGKTIRAESFGLETYSPEQNRDLSDIKVFDNGEINLPFGNTERVLDEIYKVQRHCLTDGKIPFMMGGEHLITLPAVKACLEKEPDLMIIHFDAHTDLRNKYLGEKLSHACVMRRCFDLTGVNRIFSFGIRSGTREEFEWAEGKVLINGFNIFNPGENIDSLIAEIKDKPVYFTVDADILDPAQFPATGTPEAGGINFTELLHGIRTVFDTFNVIGCDFVEFSPPYDTNGVCAVTAGKIVREMLLGLKKN